MPADYLALIYSFVYVFGMLAIAEGLRAWLKLSVDFTRKFIHIAVGMWAFGTVLLFEQRAFAVIPPLSFVAINALSYWKGTFQAMEDESGNLGTVYFPLSFAAIIWIFWGQSHLVVAALMPMTWGDALAAIVGRRYGKIRYAVAGSLRTLEGSLVMLVAGAVATLLALWLIPPPAFSLGQAVLLAGATALGATLAESISPWGIDNLTVPAVSALILFLM